MGSLGLENLDVVYCVKQDCEGDEELRYSLRSLKNFPHRKVWIYGGLPSWIKKTSVNYVPVVQNRGNKWANASSLIELMCENDKITENFVLFNDDFFVVSPIEELLYYNDRTLRERVTDFDKVTRSRWGFRQYGKYPDRLFETRKILKGKGLSEFNYELHIPMVFNREKLAKIYKDFPDGAKRSFYGNMYVEKPIQRTDVKIYGFNEDFSDKDDFVSTTDVSFMRGLVGKHLRELFNEKSKYEKVR